MSIVGPRPLFPEDSKHFDEHYIRRLNVLPGIMVYYKLMKETLMTLIFGINMILNTLKIGQF